MIIPSLLSTDLYKYSMLQVFFQKTPNAIAKYRFKCRNEEVNLLEFKNEISEEIDSICGLKHTTEELDWLSNIRFISPAFVNYLEDYTLKRRYIYVDEKDGQLDIWAEGPITGVSPFEIYVLKIVQEVYMRNVHPMSKSLKMEGLTRLWEKMELFANFVEFQKIIPKITDFGGRRAYSVSWHKTVLTELIKSNVIVGTSDMHMARVLGIKPIGTMAHEHIQTFQGLGTCPISRSQIEAFQIWVDVYRGDLGIALSDTLGDEKFLKDFDMYFAKLFDGIRHDSGDPKIWGEKMIKHYQSMGIDPKTKTLVFSDGLDFQTAFDILLKFNGQVNVGVGIGTYLTNDLGVKALQNVMKQISCNGRPTAKISNNPSKTMCEDSTYLTYLRSVL